MLIVGIGLFIPRSWENKLEGQEEAPRSLSNASKVLPKFVTAIDAHGNGYAASLCEEDILALAQSGVRVIVRLNGDTKADIGCLSTEQEAQLCQRYGIRFYYENVEGRIQEAGQVVANLMRKGGVVVHCRNGAHRAPAMAAYYLWREGTRREDIIRLVGWQDLIQSPGQYKKYTQAVLPV